MIETTAQLLLLLLLLLRAHCAPVLVNPIASRQVFTIRRIIGENTLDRNEGLWREVDALEDILGEANASRGTSKYVIRARAYRSERLDALTDLVALTQDST